MAEKTEVKPEVSKKQSVTPDNDYDPYKERSPKNPTNDFESMLHIVKGILGTGILAMPEAFKNAGAILGFIGCFVNGFLLTYGIHIFVKCMYVLCKRNKLPVLTYPDAMELGFSQGAPWARKCSRVAGRVADGFIIFYQVGVCCVYILFVVVNLKSVCDTYLKEKLSIQAYLLTLVLPCWLLTCLRNLKVLVPVSFAANGITLVTIAVSFYYVFKEPLPPFSDVALIGHDMSKFPLFFGTTCFAFQSIAVVMAVENNMKTPQHFGGYFGIYNIAVVLIIALYMCLGFFSFWRFGEDTKPSITLNFPQEEVLAQVANLLYAIAIFTSLGLNAQVPLQLVWDTYMAPRLQDSKYPIAWEFLIRTSIVALTFFFAASIPMLGLFMSLFGAITLAHMTFIFPGILDLCVRYPDNYHRFQIYKIRDIFYICYGYIGLITGCYVGITGIVWEYITGPKH